MFKEIIIKGLLLGMVTGLLVTLFDGLFMLFTTSYVPLSYPLLLIIFNTIFWMSVGGLSGLCLWIFCRHREDFKEKGNFYWAPFFLFPFAMTYGLLGRLRLPLHPFIGNAPPVFDYHLSFIWVLLIFLFLIIFRRTVAINKTRPLTFTPEIVVFILTFQFCSNIRVYFTHNSHYLNFLKNISQLEWTQPLNIIYAVGILLIVGCYFITFYTTRHLKKFISSRSNFSVVAILFIIVVICLTVFYVQNHANHVRQELPFTIANRNLKIEKAPHVILVVLDTVRADRLSIYRRPHITHRTSKNLEEFSRDALVFENCIATSSWTLPSHASLFTGLYPSEHGMHTKLDSKNKWFWGFPPLSEKLVTLAEIFKDNRYSTGAVVANNDVLHPGLKFNQGFSHYNCVRSVGSVYRFYPFHPIVHLFCHLTNMFPKYTCVYRTADDITKESFRMLDKLTSGPFFLFINYMDAHDPYQPPRPFDGYFLDTSFPQLYRLQKHFLYFTGNLNQKSWNSYLLSQYDGEIAYLDAQLGKLFARLKQKDMYDSSLIIITSDHGELFDENGFSSHKTPMYEGVIKVPLIIKFPFKRKVGREKMMITLADLYPTILSICDLPVPEGISGKTFGKGSLPIVSEFYNYGIGEHRILYNGEYKYMRYQQQREPELYNLHKDPMEKVNMVNVLPEVTMKMEEELREWEMTHVLKFKDTPKKEGTLTKEIWEGLRALGYLQ